jgi:hypothetical protein
MAEAELASDLLVTLLAGIQSSKTIPTFYRDYEDTEGALPSAAQRFDKIMSFIGAIYPANDLRTTNWRKQPLFYSLFAALAHGLYGLPKLDAPRPKIRDKDVGKLRVALDDLDSQVDEFGRATAPPASASFAQFVEFSRRRTADAKARSYRTAFIAKELGRAAG